MLPVKIVVELKQVNQCSREAQTHSQRPHKKNFKRIEKPLDGKQLVRKKINALLAWYF